MPRNLKEKPLNADVNSELRDEFFDQVKSRGYVQKRAIEAALQLFVSLPREVQAKALDGTFGKDPILGLLNYVLDNEINQIRQKIVTQLEDAKASSV